MSTSSDRGNRAMQMKSIKCTRGPFSCLYICGFMVLSLLERFCKESSEARCSTQFPLVGEIQHESIKTLPQHRRCIYNFKTAIFHRHSDAMFSLSSRDQRPKITICLMGFSASRYGEMVCCMNHWSEEQAGKRNWNVKFEYFRFLALLKVSCPEYSLRTATSMPAQRPPKPFTMYVKPAAP